MGRWSCLALEKKIFVLSYECWNKESRRDTPPVIKKIYDQRDDTESRGDTPSVIKKMYDLKIDSIRYAQVTNFGACLSKEIYNESLVYYLSQNQQGLINNEGCICSDE
ncbi:hypothetical protein H5410_047162 [Solanum commersonii]|uniref:Uncharacterized protein n=1 Tax=Solanum commersonii TaxID=4109 RepID=A0A9J5XIE0_SOLCO|nr:hypothetical protein H5410_047162 [Solanum commersonii]